MQLRKLLERIQSSFWFLPGILVSGSAGLAITSIAVDAAVLDRWGWARALVYTGGAEGASIILGTIAGSMITIAGVVLSLTLVALTLASSQLGPRLLRNFRRDTVNQVVIGVFVSAFMYCLLVLRSIRREDAGAFVPHLSISLGVLLALVSLGVLIYFIHHIAVSIQADEVIARVAAELMKGIDRLFPEQIGKEEPQDRGRAYDADLPETFEREAGPVAADQDGYCQLIDSDALMKLSEREDVILRVESRPGKYVTAGTPLVRVWPADRVTDRFRAEANAAFVLGSRRTPTQDVEFSILQLVEVAVRALSPGVNDPFTAITCVDRLCSAFGRLAQRKLPSPFRHDEAARLRVIASPATFPSLVDAAFNQIRQSARSNAAVTIGLLDAISTIAGLTCRPEDRGALRRQAEMITRGAREGLPEDEDRRAVIERYHAASLMLREPGESCR